MTGASSKDTTSASRGREHRAPCVCRPVREAGHSGTWRHERRSSPSYSSRSSSSSTNTSTSTSGATSSRCRLIIGSSEGGNVEGTTITRNGRPHGGEEATTKAITSASNAASHEGGGGEKSTGRGGRGVGSEVTLELCDRVGGLSSTRAGRRREHEFTIVGHTQGGAERVSWRRGHGRPEVCWEWVGRALRREGDKRRGGNSNGTRIGGGCGQGKAC